MRHSNFYMLNWYTRVNVVSTARKLGELLELITGYPHYETIYAWLEQEAVNDDQRV